MKKDFLDWAKNELGDVTDVEKELYGDQSDIYHLFTPCGTFFLKISKELLREKEKLEWLQGKVPVPDVIAYTVNNDTEALLLSAIGGTNLAHLSGEWSPERVVKELVSALQTFHAVSTDGCPFGEGGVNKVLVHGDACLPNFIYNDGAFSGYIDLGDMCVGDKEKLICQPRYGVCSTISVRDSVLHSWNNTVLKTSRKKWLRNCDYNTKIGKKCSLVDYQ